MVLFIIRGCEEILGENWVNWFMILVFYILYLIGFILYFILKMYKIADFSNLTNKTKTINRNHFSYYILIVENQPYKEIKYYFIHQYISVNNKKL